MVSDQACALVQIIFGQTIKTFNPCLPPVSHQLAPKIFKFISHNMPKNSPNSFKISVFGRYASFCIAIPCIAYFHILWSNSFTRQCCWDSETAAKINTQFVLANTLSNSTCPCLPSGLSVVSYLYCTPCLSRDKTVCLSVCPSISVCLAVCLSFLSFFWGVWALVNIVLQFLHSRVLVLCWGRWQQIILCSIYRMVC